MDSADPSFITRFTAAGVDNGWAAVTSRREIKRRFGEKFGTVHLSVKRFPGFEYFGGAEEPWYGDPICLLSFHSSIDPMPKTDAFSDYCERRARPSLFFYVHKVAEIESWSWSLTDLFDQVDQEIQAWEARSEFDRTQGLRVLFLARNGSLTVLRNTHKKGFR